MSHIVVIGIALDLCTAAVEGFVLNELEVDRWAELADNTVYELGFAELVPEMESEERAG